MSITKKTKALLIIAGSLSAATYFTDVMAVNTPRAERGMTNVERNVAMFRAILATDRAEVERLLRMRPYNFEADVWTDLPEELREMVQYTPLLTAVEVDSIEIVELLLDNGANVNEASGRNGTGPLYIASCQGNIPMMELLIRRGAEVDGNLIGAIINGQPDAVRLLLARGANIDRVEGMLSPLHAACMYASLRTEGIGLPVNGLDMMRAILDAGVDINEFQNGETALHIASRNGADELRDLLIARGADETLLRERLTINGQPDHLTAAQLREGYREGDGVWRTSDPVTVSGNQGLQAMVIQTEDPEENQEG